MNLVILSNISNSFLIVRKFALEDRKETKPTPHCGRECNLPKSGNIDAINVAVKTNPCIRFSLKISVTLTHDSN